MKKRLCLLLVILSGFLYLSAQEQEKSNQTMDLTDVSWEEMLNTPVTVAGKKSQKISEAPAIISVITAEDIQRAGTVNLYELLSTIPGINLTETSYGFSSLSFRGNLQTHYNNKSLVLINNHPLYDTSVGSFYLEQIPLNAIERIEIIRGPGSVLYGNNAYTGVIKVITREAKSVQNGEIQFLGGSNTTLNPSLGLGYQKNDFKIAFFASYMDSKGYPYTVKADEEKRSGAIDYESDYFNSFLNLGYKDLTVNAGIFTNKKDKFGLIPTLVSTGERDIMGWFADAAYRWKLSDKMDINLQSYADYYSREEIIDWYPPLYVLQQGGIGSKQQQKVSGWKYGIEASSSYSLSEQTTLTMGVMYENQHSDPFIWKVYDTQVTDPTTSAYLSDYSTRDTSAYIQIDTQFFSKLGLIGGLRYNHNSDYGSKVTPRVGLVYLVTPQLSLKALYGNAFRNPNFFEKYVKTTNVLFGDAKLTPEIIDTIDLGLDYIFLKNNSLRLNYFIIKSGDLITRSKIIPAGEQGNTKPTPQYANSLGQNISGLEMEIKGKPASAFEYFLNMSLIFSAKEELNGSDTLFVPKLLVNGGFHVQFSQFTLSPYVQYVGEKKGTLNTGVPTVTEAYTLLNLNLLYKVNKRLSFQIIAKNITDQEYAYPEYIRRIVADIPGGPGFQLFAKGTLGF